MSRNPPSSSRRRPVAANVRLVPLQAQASTAGSGRIATASRDSSSTFGQRRSASARQQQQQQQQQHHDRHYREDEHIHRKGDGSVEVSWVPAPKSSRSDVRAEGEGGDDDDLVGRQHQRQKRALKDTRKGVERFGVGMEKGGEDPNMRALSEQERRGRSQRRRGMRSGSKNAFRQMQA